MNRGDPPTRRMPTPPGRGPSGGTPGGRTPPLGQTPPGRTPPGRTPPGRAARRGRGPHGASVVAGVVLGGAAALVLFSDQLGIDHRTPFVQVIAFRAQIAAGLTVLAALAALLGRRDAPRVWPVAAALGLVGVLGLLAVAPRVGSDDTPAPDGRTVDVLTLSTYNGRADADELADLITERAPDLVALPEARGAMRQRLEARLDDDAGGSGYRSFSASESEESGMSVFVKRTLGRPTVTEDKRGTYPTLIVDLPRSAGGLRFVAVHPQSPKPGETNPWRRDVQDLARWCGGGRPTVVAGDMNATDDHREFREATADCTDAASSVGEGLTGTWPSYLPRVLGAQIDHVLLAGGPRATGVEVLDVTGTDHRAVLAHLRSD